MKQTNIIVLVLTIILLVPYVYSIKCWDCRSDNDPKCGDPFDNSTLPITHCKHENSSTTMCRKTRQKVNGEWLYIRDCADLGEVGLQVVDECLMRTDPHNINIEYCTCNSKDGCNSSFMSSPMPILLAVLISALYWLCKVVS